MNLEIPASPVAVAASTAAEPPSAATGSNAVPRTVATTTDSEDSTVSAHRLGYHKHCSEIADYQARSIALLSQVPVHLKAYSNRSGR